MNAVDERFFDPVSMDCRSFRKQHLAYLDDTMSGEQMSEAQRHILACNACVAHDTLVRRSLMIARSMPSIEPSEEFQARLRTRLAACRDEPVSDAMSPVVRALKSTVQQSVRLRAPRALAAVAAGAVIGTLVWRGMASNTAPLLSMQPVIATQPALSSNNPYISPALLQAMATGNPVWPAAVIIDDAPTHFVNADFTLVSDQR